MTEGAEGLTKTFADFMAFRDEIISECPELLSVSNALFGGALKTPHYVGKAPTFKDWCLNESGDRVADLARCVIQDEGDLLSVEHAGMLYFFWRM